MTPCPQRSARTRAGQREFALEAAVTSTTWAAWIFTGFLLSSVVTTPLLGKLGDSHGKKRIMLISLAGFRAGTALAEMRAPS